MKKLLAFVVVLGLALAHQPYWNPGSPVAAQAFRVLEPNVSKAMFGRLAAGEVAWFWLEVGAGFVLDLGLFVGGGCPRNYTPRLWLVGPGLPRANAPFAVPEGMGAKLYEGGWQDYRGHGLTGRKGPEFRERLAGGSYYAVVEAGNAGGYYLLSLGGAEVPGGTAEGRAAIPRFNNCG